MTSLSSKQRGLSLISLMIALTIGVFLLAGLFTVWFQTRQTFKGQGLLAQLQDNERIALTIMGNTIQTAGYFPVIDNYGASPPNPLYTQSTAFAVTSPFTVAGQAIYGTHASTGNDTLSVRYIADGNTLDCQGQSATDRTLVVNKFQIDASGNLTCSVTKGSTTQTATIMSGISAFTVLYGVSTTGSGSTTQYMTADNVTTNAQWGNVRSVSLQLTFTNPLYGQPGQVGQTKATLPQVTRLVAITQTKTS